MYKAINRIAWIASFGFGFAALMLLCIFLDLLDLVGFDDDTFALWFISWFLLSAILKKIFLSSAFLNKATTSLDVHRSSVAASAEQKEKDRSVSDAEYVHEARDSDLPAKNETDGKQKAKPDPTLDQGIIADSADRAPTEEKPVVVHEYGEQKQPQPIAAPIPTASKQTVTPREKTAFELFVRDFFKENLLAKAGGIMLFLGVLFLLQLVYTMIGPVGKLLLGFLLGFGIFGIGAWVETKKLRQEALVLMGTGILINYLVILSGRYLIGTSFGQPALLSEMVTFFLLMCNTVFAVTVSLVYRSPILLIFSFVIAYLNPFLIGAVSGNTPYTLVGYSIAVSLGALALCQKFADIDLAASRALSFIAFAGGNLLFLAAPFESTGDWLVKLLAILTLSLVTLLLSSRHQRHHELPMLFLGSYAVLFIHILSGAAILGAAFNSLEILLGYLFGLFVLLAACVFVLLHGFLLSVFSLVFAPLFLLVLLMYMQLIDVAFLVPILLLCLASYLALFVILAEHLKSFLQYLFLLILGGFIFLVTTFISPFFSIVELNDLQRGAAIIAVLLFFGAAVFFSRQKETVNLYGLGTAVSALSLVPLLSWTSGAVATGIAAVAAVTFTSAVMPLINRPVREGDVRNMIAGILAGALFGTGELYALGQEYFSGVAIGIGFFLLAVFSFGISYMLYLRLQPVLAQSDGEQKEKAKNLVFLLLGVSISLFSLAVAFVFSRHGEIVAAVWLFEASILFYFYQRQRDRKVYFAGIALMAVGIGKLLALLDVMRQQEFLALIPLGVIMGSLVANLKFLSFERERLRNAHDVLHASAIALLGLLLLIIIPSTGQGWSIFGICAFLANLAYIYSRFYCGRLPLVFSFALVLFFLVHIFGLDAIHNRLQYERLTELMLFQYLATALLGTAVFFARAFQPHVNHILFPAFVAYLFLISSQFVYYLFFENIFVVTIYWGLLAFTVSYRGIQHNNPFFRTLGLYIVSLTVAKILLYDVWVGLDDAVMRIIALMLTGGMMIGISVLYTKKYGDNLRGEFDVENLKKFPGSQK